MKIKGKIQKKNLWLTEDLNFTKVMVPCLSFRWCSLNVRAH